MKALKILGFVFAGIVVLLAVLIALALTPSIQTWAARKALAGHPGTQFEVGRIAAGLSAADVADLHYAKDGMIVTAKGVTARYNAWDFLKQNRINADQVTVQELVVDLRNAKPVEGKDASAAGRKGAPGAEGGAAGKRRPSDAETPPFEGVLKQAQLPFDVRVANLSAKGRALLPNNQTVVFDLKGAGIETGQKGKLEWVVDFADATSGAALRALRSTGTAGIHIARDRRIDLVEVDTIAAAMGPGLPPDRIQLTAKAEQPAAGGNEGYVANISLLRGGAVEPILKSTAQFIAATREISGAWDLAVRSEQLAAVLAGLGLPEIAATGGGKFNLKPDTNAVSATGDLQGNASHLEKIAPALAAVGAVQFKLGFDGGLANDVAQLNKLDLEATSADGRKIADVTSLQKVGYELKTKRITFADAKAELARISLQALPLAWAQPMLQPMVIESGDLSLTLAVEAEPDGSRVRVRALEPLAVRAVTLRQGDKKLADRVTLTARPNIDYSSTRVLAELNDLNVSMPGGDSLTGKLSADVTNLTSKPVVAFTSQMNAKVVTALKPYLPVDTGPLAIVTTTEGRLEGDVLQLAKANTTVNRENGALLLAFETQQPLRADLKAASVAATNPQATAARVRLGEIPLSWAEAFVAKSKFAGALAGGVFDVSLRSLDDVTLNTAEPVTLRGVGATLDGKAMAQGIDLTANLTATKRGETVSYEVRRVEVKQGPAVLAGLSVTGEAKLGAKLTLAAKGNLEADVPALTGQPALASFATLSSGRVTAAFDATMAETTQAKAAISAKNLVAKQDKRALGDLELNLTANVKPDGSGTLTLPITLTNAARKSDIAIDGTFGKTADQKTFLLTGKVVSNNLVVDDFQPLAGLAPSSEPAKGTTASAPVTPGQRTPTPAPSTPAPRPGTTTPGPRANPPVASTSTSTRDTAPFWKGVNGKVDLDLKRVLYGKDYVISGIRGSTVITDTRLSLDGLEGRFKENPFKLAGGLTFAAQQPQPYTLTASADVTNFDVGEFLRSANPNEKPALESKFTVSARLNGNGGTLGDLAKNAYGKFDLSGGQGVMRALARKGQMGEAVNLGSAILGAVGAARGSDTTMAIAEVTKFFAEVPFDNIRMQVERGADLSFKLTSLELVSPFVRLTGSGGVTNRDGGDIQNQPMQIMLQLGARGEVAHLMNRVNMLGQSQDDKGYQLLSRSFLIGGTPANPDSSSLWKTILAEAAKAGAGKVLPALQDLLNRR